MTSSFISSLSLNSVYLDKLLRFVLKFVDFRYYIDFVYTSLIKQEFNYVSSSFMYSAIPHEQ